MKNPSHRFLMIKKCCKLILSLGSHREKKFNLLSFLPIWLLLSGTSPFPSAYGKWIHGVASGKGMIAERERTTLTRKEVMKKKLLMNQLF
jgi:hypothetical protein